MPGVLAIEQIGVDYEVLDAAINLDRALQPDAPLVEPKWGTNELVGRHLEVGDIDSAFEAADGVIGGNMSSRRRYRSAARTARLYDGPRIVVLALSMYVLAQLRAAV